MGADAGSERAAVCLAGGRVAAAVVSLDVTGTALAIGFFGLSLTPSLLPRSWLLQGVISGILTTIGYLVGVAVAALGRRLTGRKSGVPARRFTWRVLGGAAGVVVPFSVAQGSASQQQLYRLMEMRPPSRLGYLGVLVLILPIFAGAVVVARQLRSAARRLAGWLGRWIPAELARVTAAVAVAALVLALLDGLVAKGLMGMANASFKTINRETDPGVAPPRSAALSGGDGSLVSWASLGRQGRDFVAGAPTAEQLQRVNGTQAREPIRVYVGLDSAPTVRDRAELAVRELDRTGAFSRPVLCVITTTGTGWVDRRSVEPLEYMYNGATALVAVQYSYLPSWLSFLVDRSRARAAGRELFNQVYARWSQLPATTRPKLLVFGESLGALGAESAFSGIDDIRNRTDGVLLVGPPNASALWGELTSRRDPGTPQVHPTYQGGTTVRFAGRPADLTAPSSAPPRLIYLEQTSDPVVWWSPQLALQRPDWLREPRGHDVLPAIRWYPFVTFWQLTADLVHSLHVPPGHGHNYGTQATDAWAQLASPPGWDATRTAAVKAAIGTKR